MRQIWKIGGHELALADEVPSGAMPLQGYRIPSSGMLAADAQSRREALDAFRILGGVLPPNADLRRKDVLKRVFDRLNAALLRKELIAFNRPAQGGVSTDGGKGTKGQTPPPAGAPPPPPSSSSDKVSSKTWVDIQLLDEDGDPVGGERYILKLTDGSTREGALGDDGRVRVNGIDPGNCVVTFPDLHTKEWWRKS